MRTSNTPGFICRGDLDGAWCVASPEALCDPSHHYYFLPEAKVADLSVREVAPEFPHWARHSLTVPSGRKRYVAASAINGMSSWSGGDLFVSHKAKERLQTYLGDECLFVPAEIDGVSEPYYLMWITRLVDALDHEKSTMQEVSWTEPDGTKLKRIHDFAFHEEKLLGRLLFRLPGKGFSEDCLNNFCTEEFVDLVTKLQIDGFSFGTGRSGKLVAPVPTK